MAYGALGCFDLARFRITGPGGLHCGKGQDGGEKNGFHGKKEKKKKKGGPGMKPSPPCKLNAYFW
jgi:hypothetical protein